MAATVAVPLGRRRRRSATTAAPETTEAATTSVAPTTAATTTTTPAVAVDGPCAEGTPTTRCGTVTVPLDRENPAAGTIDISFALVQRADTSQPAKGTLLGLTGGPGLATLNAPSGWIVWAAGLDGYDLLLTDYRGTGRSGALHCATQDNGFPSEIQAARTAVQTCGEELEPQAAFDDTASTADDIEAVRTALGVGPLDVLGLSYGSYVAQVCASPVIPLRCARWSSTASCPERTRPRGTEPSTAFPTCGPPWRRCRRCAPAATGPARRTR